MNIIETKDVVKQYDGHLALDRVSINVPQGCVFGLLGPNGAGKTSLIRILNMITRADSGEVLFDGHPLHEKDIANIGYLPEERGLYRKMKVADHIMYIARLRGMRSNDARDAMRKWLERFDLTQWAGKKIEALSKGMAQKVQFISTVIHSPKLLIFDEPFSGFDPVNTELLKKEGMTLSYHNHWFEFDRTEGHVVMDYLIENTSPQVMFIPDTFWIKVGGYAPEEYISKAAGRINTVHLKDYCKILGIPVFRAVGKGNLDFRSILDASQKAGAENAVIELDKSPSPYRSVGFGLNYINKLQIT